MRSMRMTDEEYDFVRWALKQYRVGVNYIDIKVFLHVKNIYVKNKIFAIYIKKTCNKCAIFSK